MMDIIVSMKHSYGKVRLNPMCHKAHLFAAIAGTQTLTRKAVKHIHALGYEIQVHDHALGMTHSVPYDKLMSLNLE